MLSEKEKLRLITQISLDFNETKDIDLLLERILTNVRKFVNADAGSIYLKKGDMLNFSYTQNETLQKRLDPGKKLIYNTFSVPINNRSIAGYVAKNSDTVNLPDVYRMTDGVSYTFDSQFDRLSDYRTGSMLTVPMNNQRKDVLGVMQLINARDDGQRIIPFTPEDESLIQHFATSAAMALERAQMTRNIILRMISMAELRDPKETGAHVNRVGAYSVEIYEDWAKGKGLSEQEVDRQRDVLRMAAMLHDVGKVAISDLILKKPARLTLDEFEIMKSHTRADAQGYQSFPGGIRVALPIDVKTAMPVKDKPFTLTTPTTTIALISNGKTGLGRISGTVSGTDKTALVGGTLVLAGGSTGIADRKGSYVVFNVPPGMQAVSGYLQGMNFKGVTAAVTADMETPMVNLVQAGAATAAVSGSLSIVNGGGAGSTSVVLVVEETFITGLERGDVPKGLRAANVNNAWSISGVPDGKYAVIPSLENDGLVRDPDTGISGTMIQHITVAGAAVQVTSFKVTGALDVISPGPTSDPVPVTGTPTFTWKDDSSETGYVLVVFDTFGNKVWEDAMIPKSTGSDPSVMYGGPALVKGNYYQFRATSMKTMNAISRTEDLKGIFIAQ